MPTEFDEIRPYEPEEMQQAFNDLLTDRHFNAVMKGLVPWLPKGVRNGLLRLAFIGVKTPLDFQKRFMKPIVKYIIRKYTDGCTFDDAALRSVECRAENVEFATAMPSAADRTAVANSTLYTLNSKLNPRFTFVSNHRDIILDSAFLDVMLFEGGYPTTVEIGIGDNLLIYPWIKRLVRMNKAFTVRRGLSPKEMLASSELMSRYIHYAVTQKKENIWIAQRQGRAKDSDDRTHDAVLKMLAMGYERGERSEERGTIADALRELNIVPLTISYEYDPCDYLKAMEMQQRRDNPAFKKSKQDDLDNMKTGLFGQKGRVHYHCGTPINNWIDELADLPRKEFYQELSRRMDQEIFAGYRLYPSNYIALDLLNEAQQSQESQQSQPSQGSQPSHYTPSDRQHFEQYLQQQIAKVTLPDKDEPFLRQCILTMYANPLRNYLKLNPTTTSE